MTRRVLLALALLSAPARAAAAVPAAPVLPVPLEAAGPSGVVQALVINGSQVAGVVLWPSAAAVEGDALPSGTLAVAAHASLQLALAGEADANPIIEIGPDFVAVGAALPPGSEDRLTTVLARLASPAPPGSAAIAAAVQAVRTRRSERWNDPLERARLAALALALPGPGGSWNGLGTPASLDHVDLGAVHAAIAAVKRRGLEVRLAGPAGLAARVAAALGTRLGPLAPAPQLRDTGRLPAAAVQLGAPPGKTADSTAFALAFRISAEEAARAGPVLSVLFETLSEGPGSLPQRLRVTLKDGVASTVELVPAAGGGGVMLVGTRVKRENAATAWRVLEGTVRSLRALPLMEAAVFKACQRLDEQAAFRATDSAAGVAGFLRRAAWNWPPPDREKPITAADVRQVARDVLSDERRAIAAAGAVPDEVLALDGLKVASRLAWERFDPSADGLVTAAPVPRTDPGTIAAVREAREVVRVLSGGGPGVVAPYEARYSVRESTPFGPRKTELRVAADRGGAVLEVAGGGWRLEAHGNPETGEVALPGATTTAALPEPDRLAAAVYREPVVLADAAARGVVPVTLVSAKLDDVACAGLRAELAEGSVMVLLYDPVTREPKATRIWYLGHDATRLPDEQVRYRTWHDAGGIRVAGELLLESVSSAPRELQLLEWTWRPPPGEPEPPPS